MTDYDMIIKNIKYWQKQIEESEYRVSSGIGIIASLIGALPRLYYVKKANTGVILFAGIEGECFSYVKSLGFEHDTLQYYKKGTFFSGAIEGWIVSCTPLDDIWQEVSALSEVKS